MSGRSLFWNRVKELFGFASEEAELSSAEEGEAQNRRRVEKQVPQEAQHKDLRPEIRSQELLRQATGVSSTEITGRPSWMEHSTQFPGAATKGPRHITIGFDLGTSCTKVILRDYYGPGAPAYLVDFREKGSTEKTFLLPSELFIRDDGSVSLDKTDGETVAGIKLHLMEAQQKRLRLGRTGRLDAWSYEVAAIYIALVLRQVRLWFFHELYEVYYPFDIKWQLNMGIPASGYDDKNLCTLFHMVARVGWWLSVEEGPITLQKTREGFEKARKGSFSPSIHDDLINVVPEVAAQVVGYAKSSLRSVGLHVLMDIGAATVDVAGFILGEREGEDRYSILAADVQQIGAYRLHIARIEMLRQIGRDWFDAATQFDEWCAGLMCQCDPMRPVPSNMLYYLPEDIRGQVRLPDDPDESFYKECRFCVEHVLFVMKRKKYPGAPAWKRGLPIFVSGGGQHVKMYRDVLDAVNARWQKEYPAREVSPFKIQELPRAENLRAKSMDDNDYHRISVAYGLSFPIDEFGEVRPPSVIKDIVVEEPQRSGFLQEDTKDWT